MILLKKFYPLFIPFLLSFSQPLLAMCQAGNPNTSLVEDTPNSAFTTSTTTATHSLTGLVWDRCGLGQTWNNGTNNCDGVTNLYIWQNALKEAKTHNDINYLGFNDWRLPNKKELESIIENCGTTPAINKTIFPSTVSSSYWSSSPSVANPWPHTDCFNLHPMSTQGV